jgi:acyl-coenzyme A thioesterase PaaI-like protein
MLTATGTVVRTGKRVGFTEGVIVDSAGKPVATSTRSLLIFDLEEGQ